MVDKHRNPFEDNQLQREATEWFVRMRGEDAGRHRADFERWLARGALHRTAYNRIANLYSAGKRVNWDNLPPPQPVRGAAKRMWMASIGIIALAGFVAWRVIAVPMVPGNTELHASHIEPGQKSGAIQYATRLGEIRTVRLSDGSKLTIDTDSLVTVDFGQDLRQLRLERGRARFEVAHELRPFVVDAGDTEVIARGTLFDVAYFQDARVRVQLLRGAVDVKRRAATDGPSTIRLQPGEGVLYDGKAAAQFLAGSGGEAEDWPTGMVEFRKARLADVITQMNRYAIAKITLADPRLGDVKVSGVFRIDDPEQLANHLALLLGLEVKRASGEIILSPKEK